jgi:hypothetical protein
VVIKTPPDRLPGKPIVIDGLLHMDGPDGPHRLSGFDYLVLRVETRTEPDQWLTPPVLSQIDAAITAFLMGYQTQFEDLRRACIATAGTNTDMNQRDRARLAKLVMEIIDDGRRLGAVPRETETLKDLTRRFLPSADDPVVAKQRLADLLA